MYNCVRDCQTETGTWNNAKRAARACPLHGSDMPRVVPAPTANALFEPGAHGSAYHGRPASRSLAGVVYLNTLPVNWQYPVEDPADGCPGGAYRTAWIDSAAKYFRLRTDTGNRVSNPTLDRCDDRLVHEAVAYYEHEQERAHANLSQVRYERAIAASKKPAATPAPRGRGRRR
jgi:hypothetical protein